MKITKSKYLAIGLAVATAALLTACDRGGGPAKDTGVVYFSATCTGGKTITSTKSQADAEAMCSYLSSPPPKLTYANPNKLGFGESK